LKNISQDDTQNHKNHIQLIWLAVLKVAKVNDLEKVPNVKNASHPDVKAILFIYSMESFLYNRINKASRE
jgi:hypothetical protein